MRKLTILGPVKRVLPARVARYDREWSFRTSPALPLWKKTLNRKVHFGRGNFDSVALSFFCSSFNIRNATKAVIPSKAFRKTTRKLTPQPTDDNNLCLARNDSGQQTSAKTATTVDIQQLSTILCCDRYRR